MNRIMGLVLIVALILAGSQTVQAQNDRNRGRIEGALGALGAEQVYRWYRDSHRRQTDNYVVPQYPYQQQYPPLSAPYVQPYNSIPSNQYGSSQYPYQQNGTNYPSSYPSTGYSAGTAQPYSGRCSTTTIYPQYRPSCPTPSCGSTYGSNSYVVPAGRSTIIIIINGY